MTNDLLYDIIEYIKNKGGCFLFVMNNITTYIDTIIHDNAIPFMKNMPDRCVDLIVTDPPYKTITGGKNNGKNSKRPKGILLNNNRLFDHQADVDVSAWMPELYRILKDGCQCYIFSNLINLRDMLNIADFVGFKLHNLLVWQKNNCTPSQWYMKNCEYVLFLRKGSAKYINNIGGSKTVHQFDNVKNKLHPTEKPIELLKFYISNSSQEDDIVFDPFCGSGTTCLASKQMGRHYVGIEIDDKYFNIATNRMRGNTN